MKAEIVTFTQEGFTAARGIKFENGLILRSPNVLWLGKDGREEAEKQFNEVIAAIQAQQVCVSNVP